MKVLKKNKLPTCETCIYYLETDENPGYGMCVRRAPKQTMREKGVDGGRTLAVHEFNGHPNVARFNVCGEWYFVGKVEGCEDWMACDYVRRMLKLNYPNKVL